MRRTRLWFCALVAIGAICRSVPAYAADKPEAAAEAGKPTLGVVRFQGTDAEEIREAVAGALTDAGHRVSADTAGLSPKSSDEKFVAAAREHGLSAIVLGKVSEQGGKLTLVLTVLNGTDAASLSTIELSAASNAALKKKIAAQLDDEIGAVLADAKAPAAEPEPEPEAEADEAEAEAEPAAEPEPAAAADEEADAGASIGVDAASSSIEVLAGVRGFSRDYSYEDAIPTLPEYSLGGAPALFIEARAYPLAGVTSGVLANVGVTGGFEQGIGLTSRVPDGRELTSSTYSFFAGLRARIRLDPHELGFVGSYGQHKFELTGDESDPLVPDVDYKFIRLGIDGRFRFSKVVLGFELGRRFLSSVGELGALAWFPHIEGGAIDAGVYGGISLSDSFDLLAGVEIQRYFFDLNPNGTDPILTERGATAGGAVDQYLSAWAGVNWRLPGQ